MVVDASVVVSSLVPQDSHHAISRRWLSGQLADGGLLIAPALLLAEIAGAIARRTTPRLGRRAVNALLALPTLQLIALDEAVARAAADIAARLQVRGGDAVYIATASTLHMPLVTWDTEQRARAARIVEVILPG